MDAIEILKNDHENLISVMANLEAAIDANHESYDELFQKFKHLFYIHDKAEDDVFYPALKKYPELKKLVNKGYQAHHIVEVAILELKLTPYSNESWGPRFSVVRDCILTHMAEEEEQLFPKVINLLDKNELENLGREIDRTRGNNNY